MTTSVGIVGFRGYSGAELIRILERHSHAEPVLMEHRSDSAAESLPRGSKGHKRIPCTPEAVASANLSAVFLATPPEVSMDLTPGILEAGAKVIDLSGAFRLGTAETYKYWYKTEHTQADLLKEAAYGLPEFCRDRIRDARLVSNPGCYPTAANLAIKPLVSRELIDRSAGIVCDGKSGVSGAGRKPSMKTSFCEVTENFSAYSLLDHRHVPEVLMNSGLNADEFSFVAQLIPIDRGILETIYFRGVDGLTADILVNSYEHFYKGEPFVRLYDPGVVPDLRAVQHTNFCDIGVKYDPATRRGVVVSVIDNLGKGAAGQAVQNMNLILGYPEQEGLL
ncbi:MAG TPA: N-acetyl-gamma-glutamyl-phosphate reductase [Bryobacteraceae bacterium]|nr:N-acetyl-gamma-glutamyl-phosphate reductase [Bryobacteraceae bacterium]